jgi:hypothetical protein
VTLLMLAVVAVLTGCSSPAAGTSWQRPDDACTLLSDARVAELLGVPGFYSCYPPDPKAGRPVWGATWGSYTAYASVQEFPTPTLDELMANPALISTPLEGIGDRALLVQVRGASSTSVRLDLDGRSYLVDVVLDRRNRKGIPPGAESAKAEELARLLFPAPER